MFTQRARQLQAVWGPCFSHCLPPFPWRLHHHLLCVWNLALGCFGYVWKFLAAVSTQSSHGLHPARSWTSRGGETKEKTRGKEGGMKSGGRQAQGGGRAKSQEHYIIAGAESEREGYESVDGLQLSLPLSCSSWTPAKPLVFKSPVLEPELRPWGFVE